MCNEKKVTEETEEMTKLGVKCQGDHNNMKEEMIKTGSTSCECPYCGMKLKNTSQDK